MYNFSKLAWAVFPIPKLDLWFTFFYRIAFFVLFRNAAPNSVSIQYLTSRTILDLNLVSILESFGFSIIWKTFFIFPGVQPNLLEKSTANVWRLRWWILKELSLESSSSKKQVWSFYISLNALPSMWLIWFFNPPEWNIQIIVVYENWALIKMFNNNFRCSNFNEKVIHGSALSFWLDRFYIWFKWKFLVSFDS